ncbi:hypothetical protein D3C72_1155270 [compost metagenome]
MEAPVAARGDDHHTVGIGHHELLRGLAPEGLGVVQVHLDHQDADDPLAVAHRAGEEVAALARGSAEAEEAPLLAGQGLTEIGAEGEIAADEAVGLIPVGGAEGQAGGAHQVDHVGAGFQPDFGQQAVGLGLEAGVLRLGQQGAQGRQVGQDGRQHLVAAQRAQQIGDVEVQGLAILLGQGLAVVALAEVLQRPEQRRQQQRQQHQAAPAWAMGSGDGRHAVTVRRSIRRIMASGGCQERRAQGTVGASLLAKVREQARSCGRGVGRVSGAAGSLPGRCASRAG